MRNNQNKLHLQLRKKKKISVQKIQKLPIQNNTIFLFVVSSSVSLNFIKNFKKNFKLKLKEYRMKKCVLKTERDRKNYVDGKKERKKERKKE